MPFRRRLLTQPLPTRIPDVDIYFHGQLLLRSDGTICDIGTNPLAGEHVLTVEVRTRFLDTPVEKTIPNAVDVMNMRHIGPLNFRVPQGMTIELNETDTVAVWKCVGEDTLDYETGTGRFAEDFRWILNLEGNLFHNQPLTVPVFDTQHTIRLQNGEYFFRTAFRSPDELKYTRTHPGIVPPVEFRGIGAVARASVLLSASQILFLTWNDGSRERRLELPKADDRRYEIYVQNTPLYQQAENPLDLSEFEELQHYYNIIPHVADNERFKLEPSNEGNAEKGTPSIPCQVMRLDWPELD